MPSTPRGFRSSTVSMALLLAAAACASSGNPNPDFGQRPLVVDNTGQLLRTSTTAGADEQFAAPAARVWQALGTAYAALGIEVVVNDPRMHTMGNTNFYRTARWNGLPLTRIADCGNGPDGPRAASNRVYFSVVTTLTSVDAAHTRLVTRVEPVAVDMSGSSSDRITCGSTGQLERMLYESVQRALGG